MKQLEMRRLLKDRIAYEVPEGYSVVNYSSPKEKSDYYYIYHLKRESEEVMNAFFDGAITNYHDCVPTQDTFFLKEGEEYIGTVTAVVHPKDNSGYVHMVCIREDKRGKGLAALLNAVAVDRLLERGWIISFSRRMTTAFRQ